MKRNDSRVFIVSALLLLSGFGVATAGESNALQLRAGAFFPDGDSDLWSDASETFTLEASDFDEVTLGVSYVASINNHVELGLNADFYQGLVVSDYRDFADGSGLPIIHDTEFDRLPLTFDVRVLPFGRHGRSARPDDRRPVFYLGGGAGMTLWRYEEVGDFIDFSDPGLPVFFESYEDDGSALELHALIGMEFPVARKVNLLVEGRYSWSDDDLQESFAFLDRIDLSGPSAHFGVAFRF